MRKGTTWRTAPPGQEGQVEGAGPRAQGEGAGEGGAYGGTFAPPHVAIEVIPLQGGDGVYLEEGPHL